MRVAEAAAICPDGSQRVSWDRPSQSRLALVALVGPGLLPGTTVTLVLQGACHRSVPFLPHVVVLAAVVVLPERLQVVMAVVALKR